jgi:asparagine synthase (glutamine-hydrolysing)
LIGLGHIPDINPVSMNLFLRYRYTPSPFTIYEGIKKLAPGTMLVVKKGEAKLKRWYQFKPAPFVPGKDPLLAEEELLAIYKRSIQRHLISDVPVGLLLSGGIDSGLLLALMNLFGSSWQTYTVGYGQTFGDDELVDAARTAEIFSTRNTQVLLDRDTFEITLPKIVSFLEEPIASSSIIPMYFVCQLAHKDVKVALVGQGPDELFGGYVRHLGVRYSRYWRNIPSSLRHGLENLVMALPRNETLKRGVNSLTLPDRMKRYQNVFSLLPGATVDGLFHEGILHKGAGDEILNSWSDLEPLMNETGELGGFQFLEVRSSLPDELLMYADKLSMAHGLEVRVPYLDREIVEYVERLPDSFKVRAGHQKWLHRRVCKGFLPPTILRRKKRGFAVNVVDDWFRNSMSKKLNDYLTDEQSFIYRYIQPKGVGMLLRDHESGRNDNHKILFSLVVMEEWLRNNIHSMASR